MRRKSTRNNIQVRATAIIWGCSVGMLGICVPLVAVTSSGVILPLLVILGATGGTIAVWVAPGQRQPFRTRPSQDMKMLEERVMNLEAICTSLPNVANPLPLSEVEDR